uniref:N,O-diacetylmuramidase n=1 Tax=Ganoderma boninense TaxID=34458 RepID=A0A5K1K8F1_9APHY|nr:Anucleate primary sterigmata protein A [Ganoderma boninense]
MKFTFASLFALTATAVSASPILEARASKPKGIDVSNYQGSVDFSTAKSHGVEFAFIKATEGTSTSSLSPTDEYTGSMLTNLRDPTAYVDPSFSSDWESANKAGIIRGAYHFAHPAGSSGAAQAEYFIAHGGGWSKDGRTLPGALDIEYNPSGSECYGMTHGQIVAFVKDFSDTYHKKTSVYPIIYTTTDWWKTCTGNSAEFGNTNPLWIADWSSSIGELPAGWKYATFWQYADKGSLGPGDQDEFNGTYDGLKKIASG